MTDALEFEKSKIEKAKQLNFLFSFIICILCKTIDVGMGYRGGLFSPRNRVTRGLRIFAKGTLKND